MNGSSQQPSVVKITDQEFTELKNFVYRTYGIDLSKKRQLIEGRLSHTLRQKGLSSFGQYMKLIQQDASGVEMHQFLNKITTNHSYFGRENEHFNFLLQTALPELERSRHNDLRIWSAGCSAGQEPYNLAMTMDQFFGPRKQLWDTTILATDISTNVLSKAREGIYPSDQLTGLPPQWLTKYFTRLDGKNYQVIPRIRKEVVFKIFNLMDAFPPRKPFDIIFCRNVMIYFDAETIAKLIEKFYQATAPGGYLFIGHSETINREATRYEYIQPAIYKKVK